MSIQKITSLSNKIQLKKNFNTQNITQQNNNKALNNTFNNISFKGYSSYRTCAGTSGSDFFQNSRLYQYTGSNNITYGNAGVTSDHYGVISGNIYFADPGEEITDKIREKNVYIFTPKMPTVSEEDISSATSTKELNEMLNKLETAKKILENESKISMKEIKNAKSALSAQEEELKSVKRKVKKAKNDLVLAEENAEKIRIQQEHNSRQISKAHDRYSILEREEEELEAKREKERNISEIKKTYGTIEEHLRSFMGEINAIGSSNDEEFKRIKKQIQTLLETNNEEH